MGKPLYWLGIFGAIKGRQRLTLGLPADMPGQGNAK
jgi:hypothetical protein